MKKFLLSNFLLLFFASAFSQTFNGYVYSNYSGIQGLQINPANAADNRLKAEFSFVGLDFGAYNNYTGILKKPTIEGLKGQLHGQTTGVFAAQGLNFQDNYMYQDSAHTNLKNASVNLDINMPSFFMSLNNKIGIGFNWRVRTMFNASLVSPQLAHLLYRGLYYPPLWKVPLEDNDLRVSVNSWAQYGFTFGDVVMDDGKHFMKAGITANFIQGLGAAYIYADNLNYSFTNDTLLTINESNLEYGHSANFELLQSNLKYKFIAKPTIGFDFGVIYEYRPHIKDFRYDMDGQKNIVRKDKAKYLFKAGLSLLDMGRVKYERSPESKKFYANIIDWNINDFTLDNVGSLDDTIKTRFNQQTDVSAFQVTLPLTLAGQFDYNLTHGFFVNFSPFITWKKQKDKNQTRYLTTYTITPRWDWTWAGIAAPLSVNEYKKVNLGVCLRLGPLVLGSNNLGSLLFNDYISNVNLFAALKIPIPYGKPPKDDDKDGISNKKDHCKDIKGTWEFTGCPDTDGDHIPDDQDSCKDQVGPKELHGCPDKDGDGIADKNDDCPDVPGMKKFGGCPDTDSDGVADFADSCKYDKGLAIFNGCPDKDNDSIPDAKDGCPDVKGLKINHGCPDTDGDGLLDDIDHCPLVKGPVENQGCPWADLDKDGVPDKDDRCVDTPGPVENQGCPWSDRDKDGTIDKSDDCPDVFGPMSNHGCPVIKKADSVVLKLAFDNLEFETGKAIIRTSSDSSLNLLANLMIKNATWKLKLSGYTDNVGDRNDNIILSKNRAEAVKAYLVAKGVKPEAIATEWFGPDNPVATNDTPEGRQKNRRVEMHLNQK